MEDVAAGQWKFTDGQSWNRDPEISITCLDQIITEPQCVYNDQTDFQGEDLPEIYGGGGVETSQRYQISNLKIFETKFYVQFLC